MLNETMLLGRICIPASPASSLALHLQPRSSGADTHTPIKILHGMSQSRFDNTPWFMQADDPVLTPQLDYQQIVPLGLLGLI